MLPIHNLSAKMKILVMLAQAFHSLKKKRAINIPQMPQKQLLQFNSMNTVVLRRMSP